MKNRKSKKIKDEFVQVMEKRLGTDGRWASTAVGHLAQFIVDNGGDIISIKEIAMLNGVHPVTATRWFKSTRVAGRSFKEKVDIEILMTKILLELDLAMLEGTLPDKDLVGFLNARMG